MELSAWTIFTDLGLVAILLLIGSILRAKVKLLQRLFLPASIIAGIIALTFGPNGIKIIPFSSEIGTYPDIMNAVVFATLPIAAEKINWREITKRVGEMWSYSQLPMLVMWGGGLLFALLFLNPFWGDMNAGFGLILGAGFVGGYGTAAAIGESFNLYGWEDATSLAMTSATVGTVSAIIIGLFFIKRATIKGDTKFINSFDNLSKDMRTGLIAPNSRKKTEMDTVSTMSIDPLMFHVILILGIAFVAYLLSDWLGSIMPVSIPVFSISFILGLIIKWILSVTKSKTYFSKDIITRIGGASTDLLIAFGIASISLPVVAQYLVPLAILFLFGLLMSWFFFSIVSKRFFAEYWFERGVFTWGWITGGVAQGIALLRIVDPEFRSKTLDDFGLAYVAISPVDLLIITFSPILVANSQSWLFITISLGSSAILLILAKKMGWFSFEIKDDQHQSKQKII